MHAHRRRATGLAALSLVTAGVVLSQAADAPGTAKEPRPASHFRLVLQGQPAIGFKRQAVFGRLFRDSITSREIAPRTVFTYKAGRNVLKQLPPMRASIARTGTQLAAVQAGLAATLGRAEADARYLTRTESSALLGKTEAEATYAKKSGVVSGQGSVLTNVVQATTTPETPILTLPGLGNIAATDASPNTRFSFVSALTPPAQVSASGLGAAVSPSRFEVSVDPGEAVTLQIVRAATVATVTISASPGSPRRLTAQALLTP